MEENQSVQGGFKKESFLGNFRWERLIAVMLLLGGIWLSRDYGTFWDSIFERRNGLVSLSYSLDCLGLPQPEGLPPLPKMEMSISRHYGVLINLPMAVLEIYGKKSPDQMIQIRNATVFVIFWLGGVILFLYFRKTLSSLVGWGVLLFYGLSPRIFGEAFFNSKDLLFCVFL